ncbi:hemerythrin domain-containing protein [Bdellovibrio bacteriovorus]|uniref:hemerythrin domain-containing protein n=1 Tax=Bdellovibrio TaxID=958 RepID=UPI0035A924C1
MLIYELLKNDHREVKKMFEKIKDCLEDEDLSKAETIFDTLKTELAAHAKAEEEVFYEPLRIASRDEEGEDLAWEGNEEHHVISLLLNELSRMDVDDKDWKAKLTVLSEIVDHHVEEEEGEIFKEAKKCFSDEEAREIAKNMEELKDLYKDRIDEALSEDVEILMHPMRSASASRRTHAQR